MWFYIVKHFKHREKGLQENWYGTGLKLEYTRLKPDANIVLRCNWTFQLLKSDSYEINCNRLYVIAARVCNETDAMCTKKLH